MSDLSHTPLADLTVERGTRPKGPKIAGITPDQRSKGRRLAMIHRHYLWDLARIAKVLDRIEAGDAPPEHLRDVVLSLDMAQNFAAFGTLCGQQCRVLTMHHDIEQAHMFPGLEAVGNTALTAIVARLRQEHEVVHELLTRLESASKELITSPTQQVFAKVRDVFRQLLTVVQSHFHYEETELEEAIGVYLDGI